MPRAYFHHEPPESTWNNALTCALGRIEKLFEQRAPHLFTSESQRRVVFDDVARVIEALRK